MYLEESFEAILNEHKIDLTNYDEAMRDMDTHLWQRAMVTELESIYSNHVQELVEAPKGIKPREWKWTYKRKKGVDGKVETYNAKLVVKGHGQKLSFNYEEIVSPIAMLKSIRILLFNMAHLHYKIWQIDV